MLFLDDQFESFLFRLLFSGLEGNFQLSMQKPLSRADRGNSFTQKSSSRVRERESFRAVQDPVKHAELLSKIYACTSLLLSARDIHDAQTATASETTKSFWVPDPAMRRLLHDRPRKPKSLKQLIIDWRGIWEKI